MPANPLAARCERTLEEIQIISQRIRRCALTYETNQAGNQSFNVAEQLRRRMETIRVSCDAILEVITLENHSVDDRITDWLLSGEPHSCLDKLKEMEDRLKPDGRVRTLARHLTLAGDKPTAAMTLFDKHSSLFHFLLSPNILWVSHRPS